MLDNETKKRIDTARDILVGKVPDPKSQVEQITIALIYKFMDDMDKEAVDFGGEATFFAGEYEKYSWTKIFDPKIGGHEMLNLYGEAIVKLNINPNIPQLFRDIFKNAYLPYRDPETLKLFLKTINDFRYDHSEMLGDAFEYLLSVLGSQGDAGQFRTPRHIIDFMVKVLEPQKGESSCDPACGTAGFLVSSYKQIVEQNTKKSKGDLLTPDDRKRMMQNFVGYDISPDMVRLSLVNLYLHGFTAPRIYEYDTLTSEERWNEYYDIIYANPPFMTPKGGIKPHKKFTVQATKSEVLFVDYIAEHINPSTGRAAIIVPNGIVATTQTAYMQLRKLLVNESLIAVISLPAGVFQPYSGVKTSILILDKRLSKKSKHILFLKIDNDGFGLGAQRREIESNDLPLALEIITAYKQALGNSVSFDVLTFPKVALLVEKGLVLENKDIVLTPDRYLIDNYVSHSYNMVRLGDCIDFISGLTLSIPDNMDDNGIPIISMNSITEDGFITEKGIRKIKVTKKTGVNYLQKGDLLFNWRNGSKHLVGKTGYFDFDGDFVFASFCLGIRAHNDKLLPKFLWRILNQYRKDGYYIDKMRVVVNGLFNRDELQEIEIPLPPLDIQQQIVVEIEAYQKIIDGAKQVVNNYKPNISIKPEWKMVSLDELCLFIDYRGKTPTKTPNGIRLITAKNVRKGYIDIEPQEFIAINDYDNVMTRGIPQKNDVLFTTEAPLGNVALLELEEKISLAQRIILLRPKNTKLLSSFLVHILLDSSTVARIENYATGSTVLGIKQSNLRELQIALPSLQEQTLIVQRIEEEQSLVNSNKRLIEIFEQKIKDKIDEVWGVKEEKKYAIPNDELLIGSEDFD
ncbi:MAG: N-6 DNA methylase [Mariniphaga sp.]